MLYILGTFLHREPKTVYTGQRSPNTNETIYPQTLQIHVLTSIRTSAYIYFGGTTAVGEATEASAQRPQNLLKIQNECSDTFLTELRAFEDRNLAAVWRQAV